MEARASEAGDRAAGIEAALRRLAAAHRIAVQKREAGFSASLVSVSAPPLQGGSAAGHESKVVMESTPFVPGIARDSSATSAATGASSPGGSLAGSLGLSLLRASSSGSRGVGEGDGDGEGEGRGEVDSVVGAGQKRSAASSGVAMLLADAEEDIDGVLGGVGSGSSPRGRSGAKRARTERGVGREGDKENE